MTCAAAIATGHASAHSPRWPSPGHTKKINNKMTVSVFFKKGKTEYGALISSTT
jgi:hypothetical protein